jgi:hypothetical protein
MLRYTIVSTMKMKACRVMISRWNTAHGQPNVNWIHQGSSAIRMKISSPA